MLVGGGFIAGVAVTTPLINVGLFDGLLFRGYFSELVDVEMQRQEDEKWKRVRNKRMKDHGYSDAEIATINSFLEKAERRWAREHRPKIDVQQTDEEPN